MMWFTSSTARIALTEITLAVHRFGLTQEKADRRTGIQLMQRLNRLGYVIEITVRPAKEPIGQPDACNCLTRRLVSSALDVAT